MGRPGGNPNLSEHQFQCEGEPNNVKLSVWITQTMMDKLKQNPHKNEFVRQAIAKALLEECEL